jgi:hypothetical protein
MQKYKGSVLGRSAALDRNEAVHEQLYQGASFPATLLDVKEGFVAYLIRLQRIYNF